MKLRKILLSCAFLLTVAALCLFLLPQQAQAASEGDLTFTLKSDGNSYSVTACNEYAQGALEIPATYQGKPVTGIGWGAFEDCKYLTSVTIPDNVTGIGEYAFGSCHNLTAVSIPDSVTRIGEGAFYNCSSLTSVTIPDSVTSIELFAFQYCSNLTSVTIPDSVVLIGEGAFHGCSNLASVTIPGSVTSIGKSAFYNCSSLTSASISEGVTRICSFAFYQCNSLTYVTIPDSVTSIDYCAFNSCSSLTSVTIPDGVTSIGKSAFHICDSLTGIWVDENNPNYSSDNMGVLFNKDQTILIQAPGALTGAYSIPNNVTIIDEHAFWNCDILTSVTIPASVAIVGKDAFYHCSSLNSVIVPDSVTVIDGSAFRYCYDLTDVYYGGTEEQWEQISIGAQNNELLNATIHFNATIFNDVNKTSWQYTHVKYALDRNLMAGKGTDDHGRIKFDPNSPITREEFVQVLYNAEDKPAVSLANPFPDVKDNGWYKNAVLWAKKNDIANGGGDGKFGVGAKITRQDLALMLYKYASLKNCSLQAQEGKIDGFADGNKVASYAKTAMDWAVTNGILSGKGTAGQPLSTFRLDPAGTATRAECAAMLKNFMTAFGL